MRLGKRAVTVCLLCHLAVVWSAVLLRIDRFPLSWAPMYAVFSSGSRSGNVKLVRLKPRARLEKHGWRATHRDGSQSWVSRRTLNIPRRNMWRLYYERSFGKPAPRLKQLNADAGNFDRWLFGLEPGEPFERARPRRDLVVSINRTLGFGPHDPRLIVALEAYQDISHLDRATGEEVERTRRETVVRWKDSWAEDLR